MIGDAQKILALIASFLFFPVGIILFIIWFGDENLEKRRLGKQCFIISLLPVFFLLLLVVLGIVSYMAVPTS